LILQLVSTRLSSKIHRFFFKKIQPERLI